MGRIENDFDAKYLSLLGFQDLVAPFWKFLRSDYSCRYDWIDNDMSPNEIKLVSKASNLLGNRILKQYDFTLLIDQQGIRKFTATSKHLQLEAICTE